MASPAPPQPPAPPAYVQLSENVAAIVLQPHQQAAAAPAGGAAAGAAAGGRDLFIGMGADVLSIVSSFLSAAELAKLAQLSKRCKDFVSNDELWYWSFVLKKGWHKEKLLDDLLKLQNQLTEEERKQINKPAEAVPIYASRVEWKPLRVLPAQRRSRRLPIACCTNYAIYGVCPHYPLISGSHAFFTGKMREFTASESKHVNETQFAREWSLARDKANAMSGLSAAGLNDLRQKEHNEISAAFAAVAMVLSLIAFLTMLLAMPSNTSAIKLYAPLWGCILFAFPLYRYVFLPPTLVCGHTLLWNARESRPTKRMVINPATHYVDFEDIKVEPVPPAGDVRARNAADGERKRPAPPPGGPQDDRDFDDDAAAKQKVGDRDLATPGRICEPIDRFIAWMFVIGAAALAWVGCLITLVLIPLHLDGMLSLSWAGVFAPTWIGVVPLTVTYSYFQWRHWSGASGIRTIPPSSNAIAALPPNTWTYRALSWLAPKSMYARHFVLVCREELLLQHLRPVTVVLVPFALCCFFWTMHAVYSWPAALLLLPIWAVFAFALYALFFAPDDPTAPYERRTNPVIVALGCCGVLPLFVSSIMAAVWLASTAATAGWSTSPRVTIAIPVTIGLASTVCATCCVVILALIRPRIYY